MDETLPELVEKALVGNPRPLEFYLREESHLPGARANLALVNQLGDLLAVYTSERADQIWELLHYLTQDALKVGSNTPAEFVALCGVAAFGPFAIACGKRPEQVFVLLEQFACSESWRVREGVAMAIQKLLPALPDETLHFLFGLASNGNYYQVRACIAGIAEPQLMPVVSIREGALEIQQIILERFHAIPASDRKREDVRVLRQALGYTLSVIVAAQPETGFALMQTCATWNDSDIHWILRENLKKKRLAKYSEDVEKLRVMLL
jgi:hypothetical protein